VQAAEVMMMVQAAPGAMEASTAGPVVAVVDALMDFSLARAGMARTGSSW